MGLGFGEEHIGKVIDNHLADHSKYKLKAICTCQWEALAIDRFQAMSLLRNHLWRNGVPTEKLPDAPSQGAVSEKKGA